MSETPANADAIKRALDNGWNVVLWRNPLGSYTVYAFSGRRVDLGAIRLDSPYITDDFEPSQALYRLSEKMIGNIVGSDGKGAQS